MQEEVTQRTVALCVEATKLSAGMLQQAMKKVLDEMQKGVTGHKTKLHHGKQTLRQLMKHNTGIWFDEKDPLIHIRTHNTDLKKRLAAYAEQHPDVCRHTDTDPETGCMEFDIEKGRFSFRLTAPYSEERRRAASEAAKTAVKNLI